LRVDSQLILANFKRVQLQIFEVFEIFYKVAEEFLSLVPSPASHSNTSTSLGGYDVSRLSHAPVFLDPCTPPCYRCKVKLGVFYAQGAEPAVGAAFGTWAWPKLSYAGRVNTT
jgi:hypothetical protein